MDKVIKLIIKDLSTYNNYSNEQIEQMEYTLKILVYELIKLSFIVLIFSFLGYFKEAILIIVIMMFTKPFIGGYHENTQLKCFLATFTIVMFIIILSYTIEFNIVGIITLNLIDIFSVYNQAPILNEKMPITKEEYIKKNRRIGITNVIILSLLAIFMYKVRWVSLIITWTNTVQAMLMFNKRKV